MALPPQPIITTPPPAPVRGEDQVTFSNKANAFVAWQASTLKPELDAVMTWHVSAVDEASTQATAAASSASAASGSASAASSSAGAAAASASSASTSASDAAVLIESYQGALSTDPTVDRHGSPLTAGDWYVNATTGIIRVYTGSAWVQGLAGDVGGGTASTYDIGTSGATVPLCNGDNRLGTWRTTFGDGTTSSFAEIDGAAGQVRGLHFMSSGVLRWGVGVNAITETGTNNSGSYFEIYRAADNGSVLDVVMSASRTSGAVIIGAPSGGYMGAGTLNAKGVYDDGTLLTCYAIEAERTGKVTPELWDSVVPNREVKQPDGEKTVEVRTHEPAKRFAARADELLDPKRYGESWRSTGHLPSLPSPEEWEASGKKMSLGDIQQRLWEATEIMAIHIDKLLGRIEALESKP